jgi:cytochrome P450
MSELKHDGIMRVFWLFNQEALVITSPHAIAEVLVAKSYIFPKPEFARRYLALILGWSLLTVEGDEHKRQRRNMLPAFSFRHLKGLIPIFWEKSREVTEAMTASCDEKGFAEMDVFRWASRCTLDIIGTAGVGAEFKAIEDDKNDLVKKYQYLQPSPGDFPVLGLLAFLPDFIVTRIPLPRIQLADKASKEIRSVCRQLIRDKQAKLDKKEECGIDILTVALRSGLFSEDSLVDQMMSFLSAGHDTTAAALTWTIYNVSKSPKVQERLRAEVREKLPAINSSAEVTSSDIEDMPYLSAVCNETLRTHSPIAQTIRVAGCDTTINGQFVPRNTLVLLLPWATNVDPQLWGPDAGEFKPERWLKPEQGGTSGEEFASGGASSNYAFMTFLHGPRSCLGLGFAKSELACLVAAWVGRFSFELVDKSWMDEKNVPITPSVVTKPHGGVLMNVRVVEGW